MSIFFAILAGYVIGFYRYEPEVDPSLPKWLRVLGHVKLMAMALAVAVASAAWAFSSNWVGNS